MVHVPGGNEENYFAGDYPMLDSRALKTCLVSGTAFAAPCVRPGHAGRGADHPAEEDTTEEAATPTARRRPVTDANLTGTNRRAGDHRHRLANPPEPEHSALPLQIVTTEELSRNGINSPEQL
jgi:iron complex outermembrane receptor protein